MAKYLGLALVLLYAWFGLLRPALRDLVRAGQEARAARVQTGTQGGTAGAQTMVSGVAQDPFAAEMTAAKAIAKNEPKVVAGVIKDWLGA